jgi:hypothetical protein
MKSKVRWRKKVRSIVLGKSHVSYEITAIELMGVGNYPCGGPVWKAVKLNRSIRSNAARRSKRLETSFGGYGFGGCFEERICSGSNKRFRARELQQIELHLCSRSNTENRGFQGRSISIVRGE